MIRLGYHGSPLVAQRLAARSSQDVELVEYDVADPFRQLRARDLDVMIVRFGDLLEGEPDLCNGEIVGYDVRAVKRRLAAELHRIGRRDYFPTPERARAHHAVAEIVDG
jgi:hypothetical protein